MIVGEPQPRAGKPVSRNRWRHGVTAALLLALPFSSPAQQSDASYQAPLLPTTVTQEVFRSRWVGPQFDRRQNPLAPGIIPEAQYTVGGEDPMSAVGDVARALRRALTIGPLEINPAVAFGWEYSNRTDSGITTDGSDDNSFFVAPSVGVSYGRAIGPWTVSANYGAGLRYYLNPNYTAAGTGNQRNPFFQSGSLNIGHLGTRHNLELSANGSYSNGFEVTSGENLTQASINTRLKYDYILTQYVTTGALASYNTSIYTGDTNSTNDSNLGSASVETFASYLLTGKTQLRLSVSAGQDSQRLRNDPQPQNDQTVYRRYVQTQLGTIYQPTEKITLEGSLGARYVQDPNIQNPEYTGLLPVYSLSASYTPTEKTSIRISTSLQGADIRPSFRLDIGWQPRVNTGLSLSVYQNQGFSTFVSEQVQVSRGIVGTLNQRIFSRIDLTLSGGWQQTENLSLSETGVAASESGEDTGYAFASFSARWQIRDWVYWQATYWTSNGSQYQNQNNNEPETRITVSFNLTF